MSTHGMGKGEDSGSSERRLSKRDRKPPKRYAEEDDDQSQSPVAKNKKARNEENATVNTKTALVRYGKRVRRQVRRYPANDERMEFQFVPGPWNANSERAARNFFRDKFQPSVDITRLELTATTSTANATSNVSNGTADGLPARRFSTRLRMPLRVNLCGDGSGTSGSPHNTRKTGRNAQKKLVPKKKAKKLQTK